MTNDQEFAELQWRKFPVLDKGWVCLVDRMGDDAAILQAARTSYGGESGKKTDDGTLLRYLMRHQHDSPFESCMIKLQVYLPLAIEAQWCLAGNTELHFETGLQGEYRRKATVKDLHDTFHSSGRARASVKSRKLRKLDMRSGERAYTHIVDIWETGIKGVFRVKLASDGMDNFEATMTSDHPCFTDSGWKTLAEIAELPSESNPMWSSNGTCVAAMGRFANGRRFDGVEQKLNQIDESTESWVPLREWEDVYEVSSQGRVRGTADKVRHPGRVKQPVIREMSCGYKRAVVTLFRPGGESKQVVIARAMLESFTEKKPPSTVCRHLDGNSLNNAIENLAWGTSSDNAEDSIRHGTHSYPVLMSAFLDIAEIEYCGKQMTYDIEVADDDHNFVAGGIVVHNCRHRVAGWSQVSYRYKEVKNEAHIPSIIKRQSSDNKQGGSEPLDDEVQDRCRTLLEESSDIAFENYHECLSDGMSREDARLQLPLGTYTEKVWWCNLRGLLHFLALRMDSHAQWQIREYATIIGEQIVKPLFPLTWQAFLDYRFNAMQLTALDIGVIQKMGGEKENRAGFMQACPQQWQGERCRERDECWEKLLKLGIVHE